MGDTIDENVLKKKKTYCKADSSGNINSYFIFYCLRDYFLDKKHSTAKS